jgi:hypothetical protein
MNQSDYSLVIALIKPLQDQVDKLKLDVIMLKEKLKNAPKGCKLAWRGKKEDGE